MQICVSKVLWCLVQELIVKDSKVAKMICGTRGRILLQMRKNVCHKLELLWNHRVSLYLYVKGIKDRG